MAQRKVITPEEIIYTTEKDLLDQDYEVKEWEKRFKELESDWRKYLAFMLSLHGPLVCLDGHFYQHPIDWWIYLTKPLNQVAQRLTGLDGSDTHW